MSFKTIIICNSVGHFVLFPGAKLLISNSYRRLLEKHLLKMVFNLDRWLRRRRYSKKFLIFSSGGHFVQKNKTIQAMLVEGIIRHISVK